MSYNTFILPKISECLCYKNGQFENVTSLQYEQLQQLCSLIIRNKHTKFIYRGDNRLEKIYNISDRTNPYLADVVFMVGEKGNVFRNIDYHNNNITAEHIQLLFNTIHGTLVTPTNNNDSVQRHLPEFILNNHEFYEFFSRVENLYVFQNAFSSKLKWTINDYYEMFLHGVRRLGNNNNTSEMLSTTLDKTTAIHFQHNGILYVGWLHDSGYITFGDMNKRNTEIHNLGLPTYSAVYSEQKEICLKCGLPPHNIIGYFYDDAHFVVNHHFFRNPKNSNNFDNVLRHGIYINQKNFHEYIGRTNYVRGYDVVNKRYIH